MVKPRSDPIMLTFCLVWKRTHFPKTLNVQDPTLPNSNYSAMFAIIPKADFRDPQVKALYRGELAIRPR